MPKDCKLVIYYWTCDFHPLPQAPPRSVSGEEAPETVNYLPPPIHGQLPLMFHWQRMQKDSPGSWNTTLLVHNSKGLQIWPKSSLFLGFCLRSQPVIEQLEQEKLLQFQGIYYNLSRPVKILIKGGVLFSFIKENVCNLASCWISRRQLNRSGYPIW